MQYQTTIQLGMIIGLLAFGLPALADDDDEISGIEEARIEGQLWTTYALNSHLNPFDISVDVDNDTATIEGEVDQQVKKDLAEQIALSVDRIAHVENRIEVNEELETPASPEGEKQERTFVDRVRDATTTTTVKSKLLWNRSTTGLSIDVDTENGVVELEGEAESEASRELAEKLAANTEGVEAVVNNIRVMRHAQAH